MGQLANIRTRLELLRREGRQPQCAVMSPTTWDTIKSEYVAERGGQADALTGPDVLGVYTTRFAGSEGIAIWHDGGVDDDR